MSTTDAPSEGMWDASDVAAYLKVSRSWVYQQVAASKLPCRRFGALLRFVPEEIRALGGGEQSAGAAVLPFARSSSK